MNILFNACSAAIFTRTSRRAAKSSIGAFSTLSWKTGVGFTVARKVDFDLFFKQICIRCYSSKKSGGDSSSSQKSDPTPKMKEDRDSFFVVRKGDLVGVYKSLSDCQTQVGSSICDPPVSVYKGYAMPKDTEEYLRSCGLKNALYSVRAADLTEDLFGTIVPCPFQPPSSKGGMTEHMLKKRSQDVMWSEYTVASPVPLVRLFSFQDRASGFILKDAVGSAVMSNDSLRKHVKIDDHNGDQALPSGRSCTLVFDGASKGNPGLAGAGAVLRADDGNFICRLREGLGVATNNAAEYRGIILGLNYALSKGFTSVHAQGDSKLVCMQIQGLWKVKNQNISTLYEQAKQLKDRFLSFRIIHVLRMFRRTWLLNLLVRVKTLLWTWTRSFRVVINVLSNFTC